MRPPVVFFPGNKKRCGTGPGRRFFVGARPWLLTLDHDHDQHDDDHDDDDDGDVDKKLPLC